MIRSTLIIQFDSSISLRRERLSYILIDTAGSSMVDTHLNPRRSVFSIPLSSKLVEEKYMMKVQQSLLKLNQVFDTEIGI